MLRRDMVERRALGEEAASKLPSVETHAPVSREYLLRPNRCEKHGVIWGSGDHEGCDLCIDEIEATIPDYFEVTREVSRS